MADKTYEDVNGNVISNSPKKVYEDVNGNPLGRTIHNDSAQSGKSADSQGGTTPGSDVFRNFVGRFVPSGLGVAGSYGGPALGAAGSFVGEGLRQAAPSLFGGEDSGGLGSDLVVNSLIPGALKSVGKVATDGFRQTLADMLATKVMGKRLPPVNNLMEGVQNFQNRAQATGDSVVNRSSQAYLNAAKEAELNYRQKIFGADNPMVTDPKVATPEGFSLPDPADFQPRSGDLPKGYSLSGFNKPEPDLNAIKGILDKTQKTAQDIKNPILRYARNSLIFRLGVLGGLGGVSPTAAAVGSTLVLGEAAIKKLVSNPETAQLIIKAINTPGDAQESGLIGKTLINALRGTTVMLKDADGNDTSVTVSQDGQLQYKK